MKRKHLDNEEDHYSEVQNRDEMTIQLSEQDQQLQQEITELKNERDQLQQEITELKKFLDLVEILQQNSSLDDTMDREEVMAIQPSERDQQLQQKILELENELKEEKEQNKKLQAVIDANKFLKDTLHLDAWDTFIDTDF